MMVLRSMRDSKSLTRLAMVSSSDVLQDAHKRRQMGDGLEDRHKDETAHAEPEDDVALHFGELCHFGFRQILAFVELSVERILQDEGRDDHRYERRNEDFGEHALCGDDALDPEHDGGDVANGREGTAGVGCDDNQGCIDKPFAAALHEFAQHHDHDDRGGEVVEDGREKEGHKGHAPHQFALGARLEGIANEVETSVGIHDFHDGHGSHEEEERSGSVAEMVLNDLADMADKTIGGHVGVE